MRRRPITPGVGPTTAVSTVGSTCRPCTPRPCWILVFAIDTSGSLDLDDLGRMWAEIRTIAVELGPKALTVIQCDAEVQAVNTYDPADLPAQIEVQGRGGTDFRPVFAELEQHPTPACLIYLTDLECDDYLAPPAYPVLWAVTDDPDPSRNPPFGERIDIE